MASAEYRGIGAKQAAAPQQLTACKL